MNQSSPWLHPQAFIKGSSWVAQCPWKRIHWKKGARHGRGRSQLPCVCAGIGGGATQSVERQTAMK